MNCKPNQLVRYVGPQHHWTGNCYGWIGRITQQDNDPDTGEIAWRVAPPLHKDFIKNMQIRVGNWIHDRCLQPIDRPNNNSVDETLIWKQVPKEIA
jgi:hypothetical protein